MTQKLKKKIMSSNLKSTFEPHYKEIQRRAAVKDVQDFESSSFEKIESDRLDDDFVNKEQQYIVFSLSQEEFAPLPTDPASPAVNIYGAFETAADAYEHAKCVQRENPSFSLMVNRTHQWIAAVSTKGRLADQGYVNTHTEKLLRDVEDRRVQNRNEFEENVKKRQIGSSNGPKKDDEEKKACSDALGAPHKVKAASKLADQKYAVCSFVKDPFGSPPEFLFMVYACYEDEAAANRYVQNTAGNHVKHFDIDVVQTCAWIFPQKMDGASAKREVYRCNELNKIMQAHKKKSTRGRTSQAEQRVVGGCGKKSSRVRFARGRSPSGLRCFLFGASRAITW